MYTPTEKDLQLLQINIDEWNFGCERYLQLKGKPISAAWELMGKYHPKNEVE